MDCWWECTLVQPLWASVWKFLKKLKIELPYDPVILLLGIYPMKRKTLTWEAICICIFIEAWLTIAKIWKQPQRLIDESIKKMQHTHAHTHTHTHTHRNIQFSSVAQSCPTLCNPMNRSTPGLPVHHQLPEFTQTHIHQVSNAIQPSHPLLSPSPPAPNPSQHQSLFQWVNSSHEVAKALEFQLYYHSFQRNPRADLL